MENCTDRYAFKLKKSAKVCKLNKKKLEKTIKKKFVNESDIAKK